MALLRTDYEQLGNSLTDLTYAAFQEIREHPELNESFESKLPQDDSKKPKELNIQDISEEAEEVKEEYTSIQDDDDPLLAAVKAFEEQNALTEEWTTPDSYFGSIRSVQPKSLADSYGILDCDRIIQFGDITVSTFVDLKQFGEYYEKSRGQDIDVFWFFHFGCRWL